MKAPRSVEKIGGTSMSRYEAVRDNIVARPADPYGRIFVVSAYGSVTDRLLEAKKTGRPGVYGLFAGARDEGCWREALDGVGELFAEINARLFAEPGARRRADAFIGERLEAARRCLEDLERVCQHGHFHLGAHLQTVREMLASLGEAHSAWNLAQLLKSEGYAARFLDLTGWDDGRELDLDERLRGALAEVDCRRELPIATGYAHTREGLMATFDRGYSEMTFSRLAVLGGAAEAVIHKEFHLSSADPRLVGPERAVPIGRTNYDVADQLANLGMEAIHPKAAKGLRQAGIPLRIRNTFEPDHEGTLVTRDYASDRPCVEIVAGRRGVYAIECFDQDMLGQLARYDREFLALVERFRGEIVTKDVTANSITHYLATNLKTARRIRAALAERFPDARLQVRRVAVVSAIGSDMKVPGLLSQAVAALAEADISILAVHQSIRQVDMQFVVDEGDYEAAIRALHRRLVEVHDHGRSIRAA